MEFTGLKGFFTICFIIHIIGSGKIIKGKTDDGLTTTDGYGSTSVLSNLTEALLSGYNPNVRPSCPGQEIVNVTIDMAIRQLISLDEPEQVVQFNMWMRLGWNDCLLRWNPDDFNGTDKIVLPINLIWTPDVTSYESISEEFYGFEKFRANLYSNGDVKYNFPTKVESLCPIDVSNFPFDSQVCALMFGSWSYDGFAMDVQSKWSNADLSSMKENVEWIIEKAPIVRHEIYYGCCPEPYPDITFFVHLKRKPAYYITNIIVPSVLVTLVASFGYLLPVDSGEKVGLELTVMLAMSVFQLLVADQLPPSADSTPWIAVFFSFTLILSGFSSFWQVIVLNVHYRGERKMPLWIKYYVLKPLAFISCVSLPRLKRLNKESKGKQNPQLFNVMEEARMVKEAGAEATQSATSSETEVSEEVADSELWIKFSLVLDRIGLFIYMLSFCAGCLFIFVELQNIDEKPLLY